MLTRRLLLGHGVVATFLLPEVAAAAPRRAAVRRGGSLPLVMLDPGHGGKDPGAIGVSGTYEKHVALLTAHDLYRLLLHTGRYRVARTRWRDVFVPLERRVEIAERHGASLFVSMHADAIHDPAIRGASVYTLADRASDPQTAALAASENSADRFGGLGVPATSPAVAHILASLVRQETRAGSTRMARCVVDSLRRDVPLLHHPARHADFVVLKAPNIPSVLVEMGFMSNRADEMALRRPEHRALVARALGEAIDAYFRSRPGMMFAAERKAG